MLIAALNNGESNGISTPPISPKFLEKFRKIGFEICLENDDAKFFKGDACQFKIFNSREDLIKNSNVLLSFSGISENDLEFINSSHLLIGDYNPVKFEKLISKITKIGAKIFSLRMLPRITRAQPFDILSSQNNLAGYLAVLIAAELSGKIFPLLITSSGTIYPAKVLIIGVGVSGMQAIATAKRLGAIVFAFDVRAEAKNDAQSVGAEFIELLKDSQFSENELNNFPKNNLNEQKSNLENQKKMSPYASELRNEEKIKEEETLLSVINKFDIIITTAQLHLKKSPIIITKRILNKMKKNSVIVDLSGEFGGNCELTEHGKLVIYENDSGVPIKIFSPNNIFSRAREEHAEFFSCNIFNFINAFFKIETEKNVDSLISKIVYNENDEIIKNVLLNKKEKE